MGKLWPISELALLAQSIFHPHPHLHLQMKWMVSKVTMQINYSLGFVDHSGAPANAEPRSPVQAVNDYDSRSEARYASFLYTLTSLIDVKAAILSSCRLDRPLSRPVPSAQRNKRMVPSIAIGCICE